MKKTGDTVHADRHLNRQLRPFLRWAGSKRRLLPKLLPLWTHEHDRYVEPFMGSASLFFALRPVNALLSDINYELVNAFRVMRDHPRALYECLVTIPLGEESYYKQRSICPQNVQPVERAARLLFLNRYCFNGLYRTNMRGEFNVPFSSEGTGNLPTLPEMLDYSRILKATHILAGDFEEVIRKEVRENDFVYMDPPYSVSRRRLFREYGANAFAIRDLGRLAGLLNIINERGATFVLSYAFSREASVAFSAWNSVKVYTRRNISGFASHRRKAAELIFTNSRDFELWRSILKTQGVR